MKSFFAQVVLPVSLLLAASSASACIQATMSNQIATVSLLPWPMKSPRNFFSLFFFCLLANFAKYNLFYVTVQGARGSRTGRLPAQFDRVRSQASRLLLSLRRRAPMGHRPAKKCQRGRSHRQDATQCRRPLGCSVRGSHRMGGRR